MRASVRGRLVGLGIVAAWLALAGLLGCAKKAPPSGGPPDIDPPRLASSSPESAAAGVPLDVHPTLTFSEPMEPRSTGEAIALAPRVDIRQQKWSGRTVTLVLAEPLQEHRTYTLFVGGGARDRHGNPMQVGATLVFTTSDTLPAGVIEGAIVAKGFPGAGTYLWCYDAAVHEAPDSTARDFDALGLADHDGKFRIVGLAAPGRYRIWAFADLNHNRSFEPNTDLLVPADTLIELTRARPVVSNLSLTVVNPTAPGKVKGTVLDSLVVTVGNTQVLAVSEKDSTQRVVGDVNTQLEFELELAPGPWLLRGFRDLDRNHSWQRKEPAGPPVKVDVAPASETTNLILKVREDEGP
jgi:hypothetical protein